MQIGNQYLPQAAQYDHIFSKKQLKNRVEFVTDFPPENDAEVVLALQVVFNDIFYFCTLFRFY